MKKLLVLCSLFTAFIVVNGGYKAFGSEAVCLSANEEISLQASSDDNLPVIQVFKFTLVGRNGAYSKRQFDALYNANEGTIKVGKLVYTIHENRAYGQENDYRSEYRYVAGDYYFNL